MLNKPGVGQPCSFYHEGGHGDRRWVIGWRYGIVRAVPSKGHKLGMIQIELLVTRWDYDPEKRTYTAKPFERVWVAEDLVNTPGDNTYHGPKAREVYQERLEKKAAEQEKVDKKRHAARRFTRS